MPTIPRRLRAFAELADDPEDEASEEDFVLMLLDALQVPDVRAAVAAMVWQMARQDRTSAAPTTRGTRRGR